MISKNSFTAADTLPIKLLKDEQVIRSINKHRVIPPVHIQFMPTNKCNLNCPFCSCANEDRNIEMKLSDAKKIIDICKKLGTRSVTITGGGSPSLHPDINEIIEHFISSGIEPAMVDNGLAFDKVSPKTLNKLVWCRISHADFRPFTDKYKEYLRGIVENCPNVDWSFSYVVSKTPDINKIGEVIKFANENNFTHIRLVADLFVPQEIDLDSVEYKIKKIGINDDKVIYQNRDMPDVGGNCYIGYLKPVISADCRVFACCGAQYYKEDAPKKMPNELCLGSAFDMEEIIKNSFTPINGYICQKCYYKNYNDILSSMMLDLTHINFI